MIIEEKINGLIFVEQRRYYVYASEEDRHNDRFTLSTSDEKRFLANKELAKKKEQEGDQNNKYIVF